MANILIADDSTIMRKTLNNILTGLGHTIVSEAFNGLQAYEEYEKFLPDIVTMDITMPILDGLQAVKKIIEKFPEAKIIIISGVNQKNMVYQALKSGAKHYIIKPVTEDKVITVLNEVLHYDCLKEYCDQTGSKNEALDYMWQEIKESKNEVFNMHKNMEEIVEKRTKELECTNQKLKETLENLKETEEKLILSEKNAATANLVAGMAHEINTPIGIGITAISYLREKNFELQSLYKNGDLKKTDFEKYLNLISDLTNSTMLNLNKACELIKSFKLIAVGQSHEEKRIFNLKNYIENTLITLRPEYKKRNCIIKVNCDENIEINNYPGAFSQLITNFVINSLLHGYEEDKKLNISISITKGDNYILLEYYDDGKGIDKDIQPKIFDAFFTTKRGNGGTGLGLNIVYNIVTQTFGGTIKCESEKNSGTAFMVKIPI